jgi:simple sugar transport system substrate-binding protein
MSKKLFSLVSLLAIVALVAVGCAPATPEVIVQTVEVEKVVTEVVEVEKEVEKIVTEVVEVEVEKEVEVPVEVTVVVEKEVPVETVVRETGPESVLDLILVQHALCAWDSFWCTVESGIKTASDDMNVNVTVLGPDSFDLEKTAALIDQAVAAQPDGLAVTVTDADLFREPIQRALDAGIPVVAYNAGAGPIEDGIDYLTYLGQDEYAGGYLGGLKLAAEGGTKGVCINQQVGHTGLDKRCNGFADALAENGIDAEVLGIGDDPAESQTIISDYFTANPDVDVVLTLGPNGANPFYAFMEAEGLGAGDLVHGTFDLSPEIAEMIRNGTTMFGIDQQPFLQGYGAVMMLTNVNRYGILPALPVTGTGPGFIDASNVDFEVDADRPVDVIAVQHALCAWDAFWCVVQKGIEVAAKEMDVNATVLGPDSFDLEKTAELIDQAVAAQPDGLAVTVTDPDLFRDPMALRACASTSRWATPGWTSAARASPMPWAKATSRLRCWASAMTPPNHRPSSATTLLPTPTPT